MRVSVIGLWHLGIVSAACLAKLGHQVWASDSNTEIVNNLSRGKTPVFEPELDGLLAEGIKSGHLQFCDSIQTAIEASELLWVTYDTALDEHDRADSDQVREHVFAAFPYLTSGMTVVISSQLPVGSVAEIEAEFRHKFPSRQVTFAYLPENLQLGLAIKRFLHPDRIVVGIPEHQPREAILSLLKPIPAPIEWMSVESAEMLKHATNAFLATSIAFANEIAVLCEAVGADAQEVERGLKSDRRIGQNSYLAPGAAFAGGTLARDLMFLSTIAAEKSVPCELIPAVSKSNQQHKTWTQGTLLRLCGDLQAKTVAVWGLTYKPGTNTLRRSAAVELCVWLVQQGAKVNAHDPSLINALDTQIPNLFSPEFSLCQSVDQTLVGADVLVVATSWPEYKELDLDQLLRAFANLVVVDASRFLSSRLQDRKNVHYVAVGRGCTNFSYGVRNRR